MALDQVTEYSKFLIYQMKDLDSTHAKIFRSAILKKLIRWLPNLFHFLPNFTRKNICLDQRTIVTGIRPIDMLPNDTSMYYHYAGSLTTPPCYESVSWYIMHEGIKITQDQVRNFGHNNLTTNLYNY